MRILRSETSVHRHRVARCCEVDSAPLCRIRPARNRWRRGNSHGRFRRARCRARPHIPIKVYLPPLSKAAPVILFSHGLGGSREGYAYVGQHWAKRGYVVVMLQHPGSDESVWRGQPLGQRMKAMQDAASAENLLLRLKDVPAVLDQLTKWNVEDKHALKGRLDLEHVGMSGHSFVHQTTQGVAGQTESAERQALHRREN